MEKASPCIVFYEIESFRENIDERKYIMFEVKYWLHEIRLTITYRIYGFDKNDYVIVFEKTEKIDINDILEKYPHETFNQALAKTIKEKVKEFQQLVKIYFPKAEPGRICYLKELK